MHLNDFIGLCQRQPRKTVAVPFANDPIIIRSMAHALKKNIADFILIGEKKKIQSLFRQCGASLGQAEFIPETDEQKACDTAAGLVHTGRAHVLMKGLVQSASILRAILHKQYNLIPPGRLISCVAACQIPAYHKLLLITDPAVNIHPTLEQKEQILRNAVHMARQLGIARPKVACVESIEKVNPKIPSTLDARALKEMGARGAFGDAVVDGPLGFDIAVSQKAAAVKGVKSAVAGDPDILLLPDLVTANVLYKCLVWFSRAHLASLVVGATSPIVITSRSDAEKTRFLSLVMAVYLAGQGENSKSEIRSTITSG
jgi:phosphate butyryltransferase